MRPFYSLVTLSRNLVYDIRNVACGGLKPSKQTMCFSPSAKPLLQIDRSFMPLGALVVSDDEISRKNIVEMLVGFETYRQAGSDDVFPQRGIAEQRFCGIARAVAIGEGKHRC